MNDNNSGTTAMTALDAMMAAKQASIGAYPYNTLVTSNSGNLESIYNASKYDDSMVLTITPAENGFMVRHNRSTFVCTDMDGVKDRVIALLASHMMTIQK